MSVTFATSIKNSRLDVISAAIDAGTTGGKIRIYNGTRPASGGAVTTLLSELIMSTTSFAPATNSTITANTITDDSSADNTGVASWFRIVDSNNNYVMDGSVGVTGSSADLELPTVNINQGQRISLSSFVITASN